MLKERLSKYSGTSLMIIPFAPLIILLIVLIIEYLFGFFNLFTFFQQNSIIDLLSLIIFILPSLCYGFFEEIGWRGFFLPQLQGKFSAFKSTLILTVIWWFWRSFIDLIWFSLSCSCSLWCWRVQSCSPTYLINLEEAC